MEFRNSPDPTLPHPRMRIHSVTLDGGSYVTRISNACGFFSHPHFFNTFHQIVGVTPGGYQRNRDPLCKRGPILGSEAYLLHRSPLANEYSQKERLDEAP
jgi:AraC-like DNA-binding protein